MEGGGSKAKPLPRSSSGASDKGQPMSTKPAAAPQKG